MDTTAGGVINTLVSPQAGDCVYIDCELAASNGSGRFIGWVDSEGVFPSSDPDCGCYFDAGSFKRDSSGTFSNVGVDRREYLLYLSGGLVDGTIPFPTLTSTQSSYKYSFFGEKYSQFQSSTTYDSVYVWRYTQFKGYVYRIIFFPIVQGASRMDLVPAQQNSSGKQGLYDVVNGRFYAFLKFNFLDKLGKFTYPVTSKLSVSYQTYYSISGLGSGVSEVQTVSVASGSSSLGLSLNSRNKYIIYASISPISDTTYFYTPASGLETEPASME